MTATALDFVKATAYLNHSDAASLCDEELIDNACCAEHDAVTTADTIADIIKAQGEPKRFDCADTPWGRIYSWPNVQSRKGRARGTMYALDAGDYRLGFFSGDF